MGWGDEIMASAQARELQQYDPRPVVFLDMNGRARYSPIWEGNPRIARQRMGEHQTVINCPGMRPYIESKTATRWVWRRSFHASPGEIWLSDEERAFAERYRDRVLIEPNIKPKPERVNKEWPWPRWQTLANMQLAPWLQVGAPGVKRLDNVEQVETPSFRHACAILSVCRAYVGGEGGMHHAAAALNRPAVVLFSGFISPATTGYAGHRNIYHGGVACGSRMPCAHCRDSLRAIEIDEVAQNLVDLLSTGG